MGRTLIGLGAFVLGLLTGLALFMPHDVYVSRLFSRGDDAIFEGHPRYREWIGGIEQ